ncbi:hypothetical protein XHV734_3322 [Xanthomonas hortorum pv. vitians]|nr:hypothetical protein XHV734_3322 [Xanthomonas hortorum pv. vitians]
MAMGIYLPSVQLVVAVWVLEKRLGLGPRLIDRLPQPGVGAKVTIDKRHLHAVAEPMDLRRYPIQRFGIAGQRSTSVLGSFQPGEAVLQALAVVTDRAAAVRRNTKGMSQRLVVRHVDQIRTRVHLEAPSIRQRFQQAAMTQGLLLDAVVPLEKGTVVGHGADSFLVAPEGSQMSDASMKEMPLAAGSSGIPAL